MTINQSTNNAESYLVLICRVFFIGGGGYCVFVFLDLILFCFEGVLEAFYSVLLLLLFFCCYFFLNNQNLVFFFFESFLFEDGL